MLMGAGGVIAVTALGLAVLAWRRRRRGDDDVGGLDESPWEPFQPRRNDTSPDHDIVGRP
jgi:heme A synthase